MPKNAKNIQNFDLGFIGHKALKLQTLFAEYTPKANEYGFFLYFEDYSELVLNQGVMCITNCFEDEKHFRELLTSKLLDKL